MRATKKLAVAAAFAVALLVGLASPALASHNVEVTGGTLQTVLGDFDLTPGSGGGGGGTSPCPSPGEGDLTFSASGTSTSGTWQVTGGYKSHFQLPGAGPTDPWFQADFDFTGTSGNYNGAPTTYALDGFIVVTVDIYAIGANDCEKDNLRCTVTGVFTIDPSSSTYNGTLPVSSIGDTATINADTATTGFPLVTASCAPPFSALNGTDAALVNLGLIRI